MYSGEEREAFYDQEIHQEAHALLNDPPAMQDFIVTHLRGMWDDVLAAEWEHNLPMLQESVAAFQTLDFAEMSCASAMLRVTGRELSGKCARWQDKANQIVFVPSAHLGPYVGWIGSGETIRLLFGARIPVGGTTTSPDLSRSELLMRLNALSDETRLRILELLSNGNGLNSQEVMDRLDLSQSAASRHLRQLADGIYPHTPQSALCFFTDTRHIADRQRRQKSPVLFRRHFQQAVRLGFLGGDFSHQLAAGDAYRGVYAQLFFNAAAYLFTHLAGCAVD